MPGLTRRKRLGAKPTTKSKAMVKDFDKDFPFARPRIKVGWGTMAEAKQLAATTGKMVYIRQTDSSPARYDFIQQGNYNFLVARRGKRKGV